MKSLQLSLLLIVSCLHRTSSSWKVFSDMMYRADAYVKQYGRIHHIDESHNHIHSRHVFYYASLLLEHQKSCITRDDIVITSLVSYLHDIPDRKYGSRHDALEDALHHILVPPYHRLRQPITTIIDNMSFSKTIRRQESTGTLLFELPPPIKAFPYLRAYHLSRQADLLTSYNVKRTIHYRMHKSNYTKCDSELYEEAKDLFEKRMWKLRSSKIFLTPYADSLAKELEIESKKRIAEYKSPTPDEIPFFLPIDDYFDMDPDMNLHHVIHHVSRLLQNTIIDPS